ncbi:hypothetical protein M2444_005618 [Paenibacillus sp. PastF-3]|uniref:hypothetical protein n=1 Tax=Paenibacillus sp. PastF-3 TaxID=2940626 RepID=UPI0024759076|nr:hypothetical protein [Paenibacillus sp. PastF-3]MDH6373775.1 hypothetical protein [Paenibacillus sp. PastF-3]
MESSYLYSEDVIQLQSQFDSMVMLKMTHDAGIDICSVPINYLSSYYTDIDSQLTVFNECITRIFGGYEIDEKKYEDSGGENITLTLPFPQMKELLSLLSPEEELKIVQNINHLMRTDSEYGDREMTGSYSSNGLVIELLGYSDDNHNFLKQLLEIRYEVQQLIDSKKNTLVQRLRSVLLQKIDKELQSSTIQTDVSKNSLQEQDMVVLISSSAEVNKKAKNNREADEVA